MGKAHSKNKQTRSDNQIKSEPEPHIIENRKETQNKKRFLQFEKLNVSKGVLTKLRKDLFFYLLSYFTLEELSEIAKINRYFFKHYKCFIEKIDTKFRAYILENKLDSSDQKKHTFFISVKNKVIYQTKSKGEFVMFRKNGIDKYSQGYYFGWAWKDQKQYWTEIQLSSSLNCPSPFLKSVCYVNVNLAFHQVKKGEYKLYLRQAFTTLREDKFILTIKINEREIFKDEHFPSKEMINQAKFETKKEIILQKQFICDIIEEDFINTNKEENTIVILINNKDLFWKDGWCIDGALLESNEFFCQKELL